MMHCSLTKVTVESSGIAGWNELIINICGQRCSDFCCNTVIGSKHLMIWVFSGKAHVLAQFAHTIMRVVSAKRLSVCRVNCVSSSMSQVDRVS